MKKQENHKPYNHGVAALALFLLLVCSPIIEHFLFDNALSESLPVGAGGLVGLLAGSGLAWLLGKSGSLLIMLVMLLFIHFPAGSGVMVGSHGQNPAAIWAAVGA